MAIFGYNGTGTSQTSLTNVIVGSVFTLTEPGVASKITAFVGRAVGETNAKCAIYKHSDLSFVAETGGALPPATAAWTNFTFASPPTLPADDYVLAAWSGGASHVIYYTTGDANQGHSDAATFDGWPATLDPTHSTNKCRIYCTYEASPTGQPTGRRFGAVGSANQYKRRGVRCF